MKKHPIERSNLLKKTFSENLKSLRNEMGLSQDKIAEKLQLPVSTYANWEQGRREPSIVEIFNLLNVFGANANDLFDCENISL